ncbi:MAG: nucleotidyltransferase domain-containing protein [Armatimonadetes bacterium]|nr:nucleotidyltransferase domain-containing protein [Armatimonadota bacterium]
MQPEIRPILAELKRRFEAIYGDRLVKLILFGSHARGEATPDSDIDVLVVLKGPVDDWEEGGRTDEATADVCLQHGVLIQRLFASEDDYAVAPISLLRNVRSEGLTV